MAAVRRGRRRRVDPRRGRRAAARPSGWSPATCVDALPDGARASSDVTVRSSTPSRWAWAEVDLDAIAHNVGVLRAAVAPAGGVGRRQGRRLRPRRRRRSPGPRSTPACDGLCVALTPRGSRCATAGIDAPILVLSEQPPDARRRRSSPTGLTPTVYTAEGIDALAAASARRGRDLGVHVKVDTGMHRVGAAPADVAGARRAHRRAPPALRLAGVFTHLAVADEPADPYTAGQLARFDDVLAGAARTRSTASSCTPPTRPARSPIRPPADLRAGRHRHVRHLARRRRRPRSPPSLRPALSLQGAGVVRQARWPPASALSYGLRHTLAADANVATVPIGYADGVRRGLSRTAARC